MKLPAQTQSGKKTMGFLLNNKAWLSTSLIPSSYQSLGSGVYSFFLGSGRLVSNCTGENISIFGDSIQLNQGQSYPLTSKGKGKFHVEVDEFLNCSMSAFATNSNEPGILTITKFDYANQIVSGTFSFNAIKPNGDTFKVTYGRFDTKFNY